MESDESNICEDCKAKPFFVRKDKQWKVDRMYVIHEVKKYAIFRNLKL